MKENVCVICGKRFQFKRKKARFCSAKCYNKEYFSKPEIKEKIREQQKEYRSRPEIKEKRKEYRSRPEIKEKIKEYLSRPEIKEKKKEWQKKYYSKHVKPSQAIEDFFMYASRTKFNSVEELKITALNYTKATCSIEGNCKIQERIFADERFKQLEERVKE